MTLKQGIVYELPEEIHTLADVIHFVKYFKCEYNINLDQDTSFETLLDENGERLVPAEKCSHLESLKRKSISKCEEQKISSFNRFCSVLIIQRHGSYS